MLKIFHSMKGLDLTQLNEIYAESIRKAGMERYASCSENLQILNAENEFYDFLLEFFAYDNACYAVWAPEGGYVAALRLEPYQDGFLLSGLETLPNARSRGYGKSLVFAVIDHLSKQGHGKIYSHVDQRNIPSLKVHRACGFKQIQSYAVFIDGSVSHKACTLCLEYEPPTINS